MEKFHADAFGRGRRERRQQKCFDGQLMRGRKCGTEADVRNGIPVQRFIGRVAGARHVNAHLRNHLRGSSQVQRRHGLLGSNAVPGNDFAGETERPPQHASGETGITRFNRFTNFARRHHAAAQRNRVHHVRFESEVAAELGEHSSVSRLMMSKAEILADNHGLGVKRFGQHALREIRGSPARNDGREGEDQNVFDALARQQSAAFAVRGQQARRTMRRDDGGRMRIERQYGRRQGVLSRGPQNGGEQFAMGHVYAVEISDGDRSGAKLGRFIQSTRDTHDSSDVPVSFIGYVNLQPVVGQTDVFRQRSFGLRVS